MILDVSFRTDIPAFYSEWFMNRVREGWLYQRNPMNLLQVSKISLDPKLIDVMVFCSKDYSKLLPYIDELESKYRCYYYYTITPYGENIEPNVPSFFDSIETLKELSKKVGKNKVGLRYDPIIFTAEWNKAKHIYYFEYLLRNTCDYIDRVVFSFVSGYDKVKKQMPEIIWPNDEYKKGICKSLKFFADKFNVPIQSCGHGDLYKDEGINKSGCQTLEMFENIFGIKFKNIKVGNSNRQLCGCMMQKSIGDYNTCLHKCKYCYANNYFIFKDNNIKHNPNSPFMTEHSTLVDSEIKITECKQESYIETNKQLDLWNNQSGF